MGTAFKFEHIYRAPSVAALLKAYWDDDHNASQDKLAQLTDRVVVEDATTDGVRKTVWKVASTRSIPLIARPFVENGRLTFLETMIQRGDNHVESSVVPQILKGRVHIDSSYKLEQVGDNQVKRTYAGTITAGMPLIGGKIERGVLEAFDKEMPVMTRCTQDWLDRTFPTG
jgi:hypothetical protein